MPWEAEKPTCVPYSEVIGTTEKVHFSFEKWESRKVAVPEILFDGQGMTICV